MKKDKNFIIFAAFMAAVLAASFYFNPDKQENVQRDCSASSPVAEMFAGQSLCQNNKISVTKQYCNATSNYMMMTITEEQSCAPQPVPSEWVFVKSVSDNAEISLKCPAEFSYCILGVAVSKDGIGADDDYCQQMTSNRPRECIDLGNKFLLGLIYDYTNDLMKFYSDRNYIYCTSNQCCPSYCDFKFGVGGGDIYYKGIK